MRAFRPTAACCALFLSACGDDGGRTPRNALLVTMDTTRADALSCYGGPAGVTPNLDALARDGVVYQEARTTAPLTMPTHASMLTGLYPIRHTVRANSAEALPASAYTLAEAARDAGLETAAFVAAVVLASDFGLAQGFDLYDEPERPEVATQVHYEQRSAEEVADRAIAWIEGRDRDAPFLLWVHFFDPHQPYDPPAEFLAQAGGDPYHAEVARMDHAIGRVIDALERTGALEQTLVVAVADHGEALEEHGEGTHGCLVYDGVIRVPLIVRDPGGERAGERSDEIVSVADVYPTIAEALRLKAERDVDGQSLFRRRVQPDRGVYFESYYGFFSFGWSHLAGWADARGKTIQSSDSEFYDVRADPGEERNLIDARADVVAEHRARLDALAGKPTLVRTADDRAVQVLADQLQALGYAGVGAGGEDPLHPLADSGRPNPRDRIGAHRSYLQATALNAARRYAEAAEILQEIVATDRLHQGAWGELSTSYVKTGRFEDAIAAARRALELGSRWYGLHENLGVSYDNLLRFPEAVEQYEQVLELRPGHDQIRERLVVLLRRLGRDDDANGHAAGGRALPGGNGRR